MTTITKTITKISLITTMAFSLTACQDPIFFHINQEVKLEEATILGDINSIIRFTDGTTEKLFIANGNIYSKNANNTTHGSWQKMPAPEGHVHSLAADKDGILYAFVWNFDKETSTGETEINSKKIYYSTDKGESWQKHDISNSIDQSAMFGEVVLMCTNAPQKDNRKAFLRIDGILYALSGSSSTLHTAGSNACSCAMLGGNVFFSNYFGACSNETKTTPATKVYYGKYFALKYTTNGTDEHDVTGSVRGEIGGLAVMQDSILVATSSGSALVDFSGNEIDFTNLTSTVSNLYENHAALAVDPSLPAKQNIIYASNQVYGNSSNSAQFSHEGLWSYYPSRGKWNIE